MNRAFSLLFQRALWSALATIWRTALQLLTLAAGIAAVLSIMAIAGAIDANPVKVIWEAPADLARTLQVMVELGERWGDLSVEDINRFLEAGTQAADLYFEVNSP